MTHKHDFYPTKIDEFVKYVYIACECGAVGGQPIGDEAEFLELCKILNKI